MRDINIHNLTDHANEIASRSQSQTQYSNISVTLYQATDAMPGVNVGDVILRQSDADTHDLLLNASEAQTALANPDDVLDSYTSAWADNVEHWQIERYRWGIDDPANDAVAEEYTGPCRIVVKGCYNGYTPYDYACDNTGEPIDFPDAPAAQAWIDEHEQGTYYLSHNEAGRPTYTIVKA